MTTTPAVPRVVPTTALECSRDDAVLLLEALAEHEEHLDRAGCVRDVARVRRMMTRVRAVAREAR